jgi:isoleucyl-tRNA synthetase
VWQWLPKTGGRPESVHLAYFPKPEELYPEATASAHARELRSDFEALLAVRAEALKPLEAARKEKLIGRSEEAAVTVYAPANLQNLLQKYRNDLRFLLIVSGVQIKSAVEGNGGGGLRVEVHKAPGHKCERCWNYSTEVGKSERYPTVCERCLAVLNELEAVAIK